MNYKSKLLILGLVSKIFAADFSVVSFKGDCSLSINGNTIPMTRDANCSNLYKVTADAQTGTKYKYICGGAEDVERTLNENTTHNELFGRALTTFNMPEFGYPNAEPWDRTIGRTELFDPSYVPIVIVDTAESFFVNGGGSGFKQISFVLKDNVFTFNNIGVSSKNQDEDKFQFSFELPGEGIYNRNVLKFRPSAYDPAFFRQILYGDIAHAIGIPTHESVSARVYLKNGTPIGLYVLQEDVTSESFVRSAFYGNKDGSIKSNYQPSLVYDCATGADFNPQDKNQLGAFINKKDPNDYKIELLEMTNQVVNTDINNTDSVKHLEDNWLDLDTLFRAIALEYLGGHWDSYWFLTTNFVTYHPPDEVEGSQNNYSKFKFYFVDQDFDQTWSIGMSEALDPTNYPKKPYTEYVNKNEAYWKNINSNQGELEPGTRVIINKLIGCDGQETCQTKELFESHLKSIVQHIFNPVAMRRKVDGYKTRLDEEIKWDTEEVVRLHKGTTRQYQFTYNDFINGIERGVSSPYGIMDWTETIATTVCNQFNMKWDPEPLDPETAAKMDAQKIDPGTNYDVSKLNTEKPSGSLMNKASIALTIFAGLLSAVFYF